MGFHQTKTHRFGKHSYHQIGLVRGQFGGAEGALVAQAIAGEPENPACGLTRLALAAPECRAFDDVTPVLFADWWRAHSARVGRRRGDLIVWDDGAEEAIRPSLTRVVAIALWQLRPTLSGNAEVARCLPTKPWSAPPAPSGASPA